MKIQHWAIIFIIIILPFSIICRDTIKKKNILLRDETRINNIVDNATYDAVSQIVEVSEELGYGKNIPMTYGVADAAIDRFFNTLSVNFNLDSSFLSMNSYFKVPTDIPEAFISKLPIFSSSEFFSNSLIHSFNELLAIVH